MLSIRHLWQADSLTAVITTAPKRDVAIDDSAHWVAAWRADHAIDGPLLQRRAQREAA
jgi:hypothetical protein